MSLPTISAMWDNYPDGERTTIAPLVGGEMSREILELGYNTCCIRTSRALNYGGAPIDRGFCNKLANPYVPPKVRTQMGSDHKAYILSVYDMRVYLSKRFGNPKRFNKMSKEKFAAANDKAGILMFFPVHCDLWRPSEIRYNDGEWDAPKLQELLLWASPAESDSGT